MTDWLQLQKTPLIVCRPALPKDTPQVLELTGRIWDGDDYVPYVWAEWLADPEGLLAVAEYGGRVAGLGKVTHLGEQEWWLEGLRVHPELEGRGIASRLHDYLVDYWDRTHAGVIRLGTASFREPVQHLCERSGFQKVGEFTSYLAPARLPSEGGPVPTFQPVMPGETDAAFEMVAEIPFTTGSRQYMDLGWQWASPSFAHLQESVGLGQAWWWRGGKALLVANEDVEDGTENRYLRLQLLACRGEDLPDFLLDFRSLAGDFGYAKASWMALLNPQLALALDAAGFQRDWDASLYLYERAHPAVAAAAA
jgi:ribosomal protein S18 acetylase RimI-like enzyme